MLLGNALGHLITAPVSGIAPAPIVAGCRLWLPLLDDAEPLIDGEGNAVQAVDFNVGSYYWDAAASLLRVAAGSSPKFGIWRPGLSSRGLILDGGRRNLVASQVGGGTLMGVTRTVHNDPYVVGNAAYLLQENTATGVHRAVSPSGATYLSQGESVVASAIVEPFSGDRWAVINVSHSPESVKVAFDLNNDTINVLAGAAQIQRTGMLELGGDRYLCWFQFYRAASTGGIPTIYVALSVDGTAEVFPGNGTSGLIVHHTSVDEGAYPVRAPGIGPTAQWPAAEAITLSPASLYASDWTVFFTWVPGLDSPWVTGLAQYGQAQAFTTFDGQTGGTNLRMYSSSQLGSGIAFDWCVNDEPVDSCNIATTFVAGQPIAVAAEFGESYQRLFIRKPGESMVGSTLVTDTTPNPFFQIGGGFWGGGGIIRDFMVYPVLPEPNVNAILGWMLARAA